ncbi:MAG: cytochrome c biogenesis protein ResB [Proteobacteria bacterium]|nr:cytochrome c biogenesis protein ResB [Pseudomonadota bacterium]
MEEKPASNSILTPIWNFFASVKLSVITLLLLAITSIIGTILPQNESPEAYYHSLGETLFNVFSTLDLFDMYHSRWYQFLLLLLCANLVICSLNRLSSTYKIVFIKKPVFNLAQFRKAGNRQDFTSTLPIESLVEKFLQIIESKFAKCIVEKNETGYAIFSEKGRWTRLGVYGVHLSIILMIAGGLAGSMYGFEGYMTIPEKSSEHVIHKRKSNETIALDFVIRCDKFDVSFYDTGAPKEYRSSLTILENGKEELKQDIIVNKPLRYQGINIFQSSYGTTAPETVSLTFTSRETGMEFTKSVSIGEEVDIPGGLGKFTLQQFAPSFRFRGHNIGETFIGELTSDGSDPKQIVIPVQFAKFDKMRGGDVIISAGNFEKRYYTGLQVTKDPGVYIVYTGFILIILGCFITFFMSHQKLCVEIQKEKDNCQVMIAGTANKNKMGIKFIVDRITEKLSKISR